MSAAPALAGAKAVVTGASRGIGRAVAHALAAAGARVALLARDREALSALASELGGGAFAVPCDVTHGEEVRVAARAIAEAFGGAATILINNAGIYRLGAAHELAEDELKSMLDTNVIAPFAFVRELLPAMLAARRGHVVTIGSRVDRVALPGNAGYSMTKFGMRALHEVLREETKGTGVRASLVSPSATDSPIWHALTAEQRARFPAAEDMLRPDDVARAVLYAVTQPPTVNVDELRITRA